MKRITLLITAIATTSLLMGCSNTKKQLGLGRKTPDEFAVLKRAPLEIPPDLRALPVPRKGAPRPQEDTTEETAQKTLFGENTPIQPQTSNAIERSVLSKANATKTDPSIRTLIDEEADKYATENQAVIDKLLKRKKVVPGSTLDAREELDRLKGKADIPTPHVPPPLENK